MSRYSWFGRDDDRDFGPRHGRGGGGGRHGRGFPPGPPPPPGPPGAPPFGPPFGPPWAQWAANFFGGPRHRARRGNVRAAILSVLANEPLNGYQIMQAIEQRSQGMWRPSSGSIYPTLQLLEDEGLLQVDTASNDQGSSRTYKLTAKGKRYVEDRREELDAEWTAFEQPDAQGAALPVLMAMFRDVAAAAMQVAQSGTAAQVEEARKLLAEVRRKLYGILAEDPDDE
jgi:DNA-binding PadR family transcriptional regulator